MHIQYYIAIGVVIALASILQSAVGFAFGMFSIPILVWMGVPLPYAVCLIFGVITCQTGWGVYQYKEYADIRPTIPVSIFRAATIPIGVLILGFIIGLGEGSIKQMIGIVMLIAILTQFFSKIKPKKTVKLRWGVIAGFFSGILTGLSGMGGPPVVLWIMAHDWPTKRIRSSIWLITLQTIPVMILIFAWRFGVNIFVAYAIGLACFPIAIVFSSIGLKLGSLMSRNHLRKVAFALLIIIALISIIQPIINTF